MENSTNRKPSSLSDIFLAIDLFLIFIALIFIFFSYFHFSKKYEEKLSKKIITSYLLEESISIQEIPENIIKAIWFKNNNENWTLLLYNKQFIKKNNVSLKYENPQKNTHVYPINRNQFQFSVWIFPNSKHVIVRYFIIPILITALFVIILNFFLILFFLNDHQQKNSFLSENSTEIDLETKYANKYHITKEELEGLIGQEKESQ